MGWTADAAGRKKLEDVALGACAALALLRVAAVAILPSAMLGAVPGCLELVLFPVELSCSGARLFTLAAVLLNRLTVGLACLLVLLTSLLQVLASLLAAFSLDLRAGSRRRGNLDLLGGGA